MALRTPTAVATKVCGKCKIERPAYDFAKNRTTKDGLQQYCTPCHREYRNVVFSPAVAEKLCGRCKVVKPAVAFSIARASADGLQKWCKECIYQYNIDNSDRNTARVRRWLDSSTSEEKLKQSIGVSCRKWGCTIAEYNAMLEAQGGTCYICKLPESHARYKRLSIDHCHETGVVRGLLCHKCNTILGLARDRVDILQAAIAYLQERGGK